jgi:hypothetical protein
MSRPRIGLCGRDRRGVLVAKDEDERSGKRSAGHGQQ